MAAAKLVNAHDFITHMEHGYDSDVGEGGGQLSTGEKQLISFARAVLANPRIFVLDEATASIDTKTEALIQEAISTLLTGRTSFLIAHRLSTIRKADMILVVRAGKIIERGTHRELMALGGYYADLYNKQFETESARKRVQPIRRENTLLPLGRGFAVCLPLVVQVLVLLAGVAQGLPQDLLGVELAGGLVLGRGGLGGLLGLLGAISNSPVP